MLSGRVKSWGPQVFLDGAAAACSRSSANATGFTQPAHMFLVHLSRQPHWEIAVNSDRTRTGGILPGTIEIVPANSQAFASWREQKRSLRVDIDASRLRQIAGAEFDNDSFELQPPAFGFVDKPAQTLALLIQRELEGGDALSHCVLDSLITIFSVHMLRNYSSLAGRSSPRGGLPPATLLRVKEFIRENIPKTLTGYDLASVAGLSLSHFNRAFKQSTGQSPHQFVIAVRLAHARDLLLNTREPITFIATSAGFSSQSHMTAQMTRAWDISPSDIRKNR